MGGAVDTGAWIAVAAGLVVLERMWERIGSPLLDKVLKHTSRNGNGFRSHEARVVSLLERQAEIQETQQKLLESMARDLATARETHELNKQKIDDVHRFFRRPDSGDQGDAYQLVRELKASLGDISQAIQSVTREMERRT